MEWNCFVAETTFTGKGPGVLIPPKTKLAKSEPAAPLPQLQEQRRVGGWLNLIQGCDSWQSSGKIVPKLSRLQSLTVISSSRPIPPRFPHKNKVLTGSHVSGLSINPFCLRGVGLFWFNSGFRDQNQDSEEKGDFQMVVGDIYSSCKFIIYLNSFQMSFTSNGSHKTVFTGRSHWQPWGGLWRATPLGAHWEGGTLS